MFRSPPPEEPAPLPLPQQRPWSARLAWLTLAVAAGVLVTRMSIATVVCIHGEGMAPALRSGDYVLLLRDRRSLARGDIVVYDPGATPERGTPEARGADEDDAWRASPRSGERFPDPSQSPRDVLRDTAVVDRDAVESHWARIRQTADRGTTRTRDPMRVGRILAMPGDTVAFHVRGAPLGLAIGDHAGLVSSRPDTIVDGPRNTEPLEAWPGMKLPDPGEGPVEVSAQGYLVVADNRDEAACCDSRALGWIPDDALRGKVLMRLSAMQTPPDPLAGQTSSAAAIDP